MKLKPILCMAVAITALAILAGCSSAPTSSEVGELRIRLIDSPADYDQVNIVVSKVEVHATGSDSLGGWSVINDDTVTYDLLVLRNGANAILGEQMLPIGKYTQIRLTIDSGSNVVVGGVTYPLDIAGQEVVKLNHNFNVESDGLIELTLDFDADRSIDSLGDNQYRLRPVIEVKANVIVGGDDNDNDNDNGNDVPPSISGIVSPASARASVMALGGPQLYSTVCDSTTGSFGLMGLASGIYTVFVMPTDGVHGDTTIVGVSVTANVTTSLGTIAVPLN